ncbi:hypothetical protein KSS87_006423 [Heliosperma pusillum]|nr:hypothetical protein KSS87_006423 [Heliosperma pusillum]
MRIPSLGVVCGWFENNIIDPFMVIIRRGTEPKQLAFSAALGSTLGIFPIVGISTGVTVLLCGLAIPILGSRCHPPTVLLLNFVVTPIELSLILPFLRLGETICGTSHFPLSSDALKKVFTGQASTQLLLTILHALVGWLFLAPFILPLLYVLFLPCFKLLVRRFKPKEAPLRSEA